TASARLRAITITRSSTVSSSSARGLTTALSSVSGIAAASARVTSALSAITRSSGRVRLAAMSRSTNSRGPTFRARTRPTPPAPRGAHALDLADARADALARPGRRGVGERLDGAPAEPPAGEADEQRNHEGGRRVGPGIAEPEAGKAEDHGGGRPHVGAEMQ